MQVATKHIYTEVMNRTGANVSITASSILVASVLLSFPIPAMARQDRAGHVARASAINWRNLECVQLEQALPKASAGRRAQALPTDSLSRNPVMTTPLSGLDRRAVSGRRGRPKCRSLPLYAAICRTPVVSHRFLKGLRWASNLRVGGCGQASLGKPSQPKAARESLPACH